MREKPPFLTVLIPHFNEKAYVQEILRRVQAVPIDKEVILVDDGSTDDCRHFLKTNIEGSYPNLKIIYHEKNQGKGAAIRTGLVVATGDIVLIQDADLEYNPEDYSKICDPFGDPEVKVVYGTRYRNTRKRLFVWHWFCNRFLGGQYEMRYLHHFIGIQVLNLLANILYSANISDEATCYKVFRRNALEKIHLRCKGFEFCPEVTAKVRKAGFRIIEIPVSYHPRSHEQGKKLNWRHGFAAIYTLIKYRFVD